MKQIDKVNVIEHCYECPFKTHYSEHGFCGDCCKFIAYGLIPAYGGILEKCPMKGRKISFTVEG